MTSLDNVRSGLDWAKAAVGAAETTLREGREIDLGGLETGVEALCADIAALDPSERGALKPALIGLIDDLNRLAEEIARRNRAAGEELRSTNEHQRAASAYLSSRGKDPVR